MKTILKPFTAIIFLSLLLIQGCILTKDTKETTGLTGIIILDTTANYKPCMGDRYLFEVRWSCRPQFLILDNEILDSIVSFLSFYTNVVCEIGVHTDFRGSTEFNDTLSDKQARPLTEYLVQKGVDPNRITPVGYGERVPRILESDLFVPEWKVSLPKGAHLTAEYINKLKTSNEREAAHKLNRRGELKVTGFLETP